MKNWEKKQKVNYIKLYWHGILTWSNILNISINNLAFNLGVQLTLNMLNINTFKKKLCNTYQTNHMNAMFEIYNYKKKQVKWLLEIRNDFLFLISWSISQIIALF